MKIRIITTMIILSQLVFIPTWGQTTVIKRQTTTRQKTTPTKTSAKSVSNANVSPQKQEEGIYYLCLNWGYNLRWSQQICREMRAKGYPSIVVADGEGFILNSSQKGNSNVGYMCCVKPCKSRSEAADFYKSFSDSRYNIVYIRYNFHDISSMSTGLSIVEFLSMNGSQLYQLAEDYYYGRNGKSIDKYDANQVYSQAAYIDYAPAQLKLGLLYENGEGGTFHNEYNSKIAVKWYQKAVDNGNAEAMARLSDYYIQGKGGLAKDNNKALDLIKQSVDQCDAYGMSNMGYMYVYGLGVNKDYNEAIKWITKSAEKNNEWGLNWMGHIYYSGYGTDKNYVEALKWYRKAADLGSGAGMYHCGLVYYNGGNGVTKDLKEAFTWFKKAADKGYKSGMFWLGRMYENGYGTTQNYDQAKRWYEKGANKGDDDSMYSLGRFYEYGYGVSVDLSKAKEWYEKAMSEGYEQAKKKLNELMSK